LAIPLVPSSRWRGWRLCLCFPRFSLPKIYRMALGRRMGFTAPGALVAFPFVEARPRTRRSFREFEFDVASHVTVVLRFDYLAHHFLFVFSLVRKTAIARTHAEESRITRAVREDQNRLRVFGKRFAFVDPSTVARHSRYGNFAAAGCALRAGRCRCARVDCAEFTALVSFAIGAMPYRLPFGFWTIPGTGIHAAYPL